MLLSQILNHTGVSCITEQFSTQNDFVIFMVEKWDDTKTKLKNRTLFKIQKQFFFYEGYTI